MIAERQIGHAPKTKTLGQDIASLRGCVGCPGCKGLCQTLIDALLIPGIVLRKGLTLPTG